LATRKRVQPEPVSLAAARNTVTSGEGSSSSTGCLAPRVHLHRPPGLALRGEPDSRPSEHSSHEPVLGRHYAFVLGRRFASGLGRSVASVLGRDVVASAAPCTLVASVLGRDVASALGRHFVSVLGRHFASVLEVHLVSALRQRHVASALGRYVLLLASHSHHGHVVGSVLVPADLLSPMRP